MNGKVGKYATIKKSKVEWFWHPYVPFGKITLMQGDPGDGKSTLALKLAAIASNAGSLPDGKKLTTPLNVIYQCLEDGIADTIIPRLERVGANIRRIYFIQDDGRPSSVLDRETIEQVINETKAGMLIIDPIQTVLGKLIRGGECGAVRSYVEMLASVANQTGCAVILIGHLNKNESGKELYRGLGSIDIIAAARSVIRVERIMEGSSVRVIRHVKASLSREGEDFAFEIDSNGEINWVGAVNATDEGVEIVEQAKKGKTKKYDRVLGKLRSILGKGDLPYSVIVEKTKCLSGVRTLNEAKKELGIQSIKKADGWYWHLPKEG